LYGFETWSLALRDEHKVRVFENRVLSRIFGPQREDLAGGWRTLHNEELHNLNASPNIMVTQAEDEMGGTCSAHGWHEKFI
jgi:hypothetical protein